MEEEDEDFGEIIDSADFEQFADFQHLLKVAQDDLRVRAQIIDQLKSENADKESQIILIRQTLQEMENKFADLESAQTALQSQSVELTSEIISLQSQLKLAQLEKVDHEKREAEVAQKNSHLQAELSLAQQSGSSSEMELRSMLVKSHEELETANLRVSLCVCDRTNAELLEVKQSNQELIASMAAAKRSHEDEVLQLRDDIAKLKSLPNTDVIDKNGSSSIVIRPSRRPSVKPLRTEEGDAESVHSQDSALSQNTLSAAKKPVAGFLSAITVPPNPKEFLRRGSIKALSLGLDERALVDQKSDGERADEFEGESGAPRPPVSPSLSNDSAVGTGKKVTEAVATGRLSKRASFKQASVDDDDAGSVNSHDSGMTAGSTMSSMSMRSMGGTPVSKKAVSGFLSATTASPNPKEFLKRGSKVPLSLGTKQSKASKTVV